LPHRRFSRFEYYSSVVNNYSFSGRLAFFEADLFPVPDVIVIREQESFAYAG
jgi:hypothetical protein